MLHGAMKDIFPSRTTKNDTKHNAQTFNLDEKDPELDLAQTGDESELRQKKHKIVDPRTCSDIQFAGWCRSPTTYKAR